MAFSPSSSELLAESTHPRFAVFGIEEGYSIDLQIFLFYRAVIRGLNLPSNAVIQLQVPYTHPENGSDVAVCNMLHNDASDRSQFHEVANADHTVIVYMSGLNEEMASRVRAVFYSSPIVRH